MSQRIALDDFALANPLYASALVYVYEVNASLSATATLAKLYAGPAGNTLAGNPQRLDSRGKFAKPIYVEQPVVMSVEVPGQAATVTGVASLWPRWRGIWAAGTLYYPGERVQHPLQTEAYSVLIGHVSSDFAADQAANRLELEFAALTLDQTALATLKVGTNQGNLDGTGIQIGGAGGTDPYGSFFKKDGHANWTVLQSGKIYNPVEWNIYSSAALGDCNIVAGTNTVTLLNGLPPQQDWIGEALYVGTIGGYEITAVNTTTNPAGTVGVVTVRNFGGAALTWGASQSNVTWQYQVTSSDGICNVSGTTVTWVSGQKFIPFGPATIIIGGTRYTVSTATLTNITLTASAGTRTNVAFSNRMNINDQLVCTRMQMRAGASEENMTWSARAGTEYQLSVFATGNGACYPMRFSNGSLPNGLPQYLLTIHQGSGKIGQDGNGFVDAGGDDRFGQASLRIQRNPAGAVNRLDIIGGDKPEYLPSLRGRGTPTDVGVSIDTQNAGPVRLTGHQYGEIMAEFITAGQGVPNYLQFANATSSTAPTIRARNNTSNNASLGYDTQGSGSHDFTAHTFGEFVFRAFTAEQGAPNYAQLWNAATGLNPNFRGRSPNANATVGLNFDGQRDASFAFSNNSFSNPLLNIAGAAGSNTFIEVNSGTNSAAIIGKGTVGVTNADLVLGKTGGGAVRLDYDPAAGSNSRELAPTSWVRNTARLRTEATYTFFAELAPTLNQVVAAFPVGSSGRIPAGLVGSSMLAGSASTGAAAVQLWGGGNWTTIGTFTFSASVQPSLSGAPVADLPVIEGTHRLRVIATTPWTKAGLEVRLKQL